MVLERVKNVVLRSPHAIFYIYIKYGMRWTQDHIFHSFQYHPTGSLVMSDVSLLSGIWSLIIVFCFVFCSFLKKGNIKGANFKNICLMFVCTCMSFYVCRDHFVDLTWERVYITCEKSFEIFTCLWPEFDHPAVTPLWLIGCWNLITN